MVIWVILKSLKKNCLAKKSFYSSLTGKNVSDKGYEHALKVWDKSKMKTMKDYHDLHLKCDVLLLADVFEKFGNIAYRIMGNVRVIIWAHQLKLGCSARYDKSWDSGYSRSWNVYILQKRYERWSFLYF